MKRTPLLRKTPLKRSMVRMKQSRSTGRPTKAEAARFKAMAQYECMACCQNAAPHATCTPLEIHHLLSGGRRIGHHATILLCSYHHQGKLLPGAHTSYKVAAEIFGPSLEREPRKFHECYGTDAELLNFQNAIIELGL